MEYDWKSIPEVFAHLYSLFLISFLNFLYNSNEDILRLGGFAFVGSGLCSSSYAFCLV